MLSSKKLKRLESKRKKAQAFLELVGHDISHLKLKSKVLHKDSGHVGVEEGGASETQVQQTLDSSACSGDSVSGTASETEDKRMMSLRTLSKDQHGSTLKNDTHDHEANSKSSDLTGNQQQQVVDKSQMSAVVTHQENEYDEEALKAEARKMIRQRKKQVMEKPKLFLILEEMMMTRPTKGEKGDGMLGKDNLPPLFITDLQQLLLYALQGNMCSFKPRWCKLLRVAKVSSVVAIILDGVSYDDFVENKTNFQCLSESFETKLEFICPKQYNLTVDEEMYAVPLSITQLKKANVKVKDNIKSKVASKIRPAQNPNKTEVISRLCLLLSSYQMKLEGYPLPVETHESKYKDFVFSKHVYREVTSESPMYGLDCEMCLTSIQKNEVTRVSIVTEKGEVIYDSLVKPRNKIINYLTRFSGITPEMMATCTTHLEDVQRDLQGLLPPDVILCGQSLNMDLNALKMFHPYVVDTSVIYNMSGNRGVKAGLRKLSSFFLDRNIQGKSSGHCSAEDAKATLDLVLLKLRNGLEFGDATISGVYFPNIQTYFLGGQDGAEARSENVEKEPEDEAQASPKQEGNVMSESLSAECQSEVALKRKADERTDTEDIPAKKMKPWTYKREAIKFFIQNHSAFIDHSFFRLAYEAGRTCALIGKEEHISKYTQEPVDIKNTQDDKETKKIAKELMQNKEFVMLRLRAFEDILSTGGTEPNECENIFKKLDKRVRSIIKSAKPNSLIAVLLTGRNPTADRVNNSMVFAKIT